MQKTRRERCHSEAQEPWSTKNGAEDQSRTDDTRIFSLESMMTIGVLEFKLDITHKGRKCDSVLGVASGDNLCHSVG